MSVPSDTPRPPRLADALLAWFCAPHWLEEVQGDLHEVFSARAATRGRRVARLRYWIDVFRYVRPYILRRHRLPYASASGFAMWTNYLRTAFRNLRKRPGFTAINILGLGVGLAASLLIGLYVHHELTYDRFHTNADRIYQVYKERQTPTGTQITRDTWVPLRDALVETYPAVEAGARIYTTDAWVTAGADRFEETVTFTDAALFKVFDFPLALGDPATAFANPNGIVISEAIARKYFGGSDPLGRTLTVDDELDYTVTGVLAPIPSNSTIQIDLAAPLVSVPFYEEVQEEWGGSFLFTYVLLNDAADVAALEAQFPQFVERIWDAEEARRTAFRLEALPELQNAVNSNRRYAIILLIVAVAILAIATINFTNLTTARSMERAREIGMRKVLGARRGQVVQQFFSEALLMSFGALAIGLVLARLVLPWFNDLYGLRLSMGLLGTPEALLGLPALGLVVGLLAGAYPALVLSGFRPIASLKGSLRGGGSARLRQGLVVVQFALATVLLVGTFVVRDQIAFMQEANLNFDREQVVVIPVEAADFPDAEAANERLQTFKDELRRQSRVAAVSSSSHTPGDWAGWFMFIRPADTGPDTRFRMRRAYVDDTFFATYGIDLVSGRTFSAERGEEAERRAVVLNEAAVRAFGWPAAEGRSVTVGPDVDVPVIGVVADYHVQSLQNEIAPIIHFYRPPTNAVHNFVSVRLQPGDAQQTLADLEGVWQRTVSERALPYVFVDDQFRQIYANEERLATIAGAFTLLGLIVAALGLFGLASLLVAQRTKEIGVRKVLGASVPGLVMLLAKDFAALVAVAIAVAVPVAYLALDAWLRDFAYHTTVGADVFLLAGTLALAVALGTVGLQSVRTALRNPVETLRYE